jgi:hypothetical protein
MYCTPKIRICQVKLWEHFCATCTKIKYFAITLKTEFWDYKANHHFRRTDFGNTLRDNFVQFSQK